MYIACIFTNIYEEWTDNFPVDFQDSLLSNWGAPKRWHCPLPPGGYLQVWCHDGRLEEQSSPENPKIFHHTGGTWDDEMERLEAYVCWVFVTGALFVLNFPQITRKKKKQDDGWMDSEKDTLWRTSLNAGCILGVAIILSLDWLINVTYLTITTVSPSEIRTMIWQCISACYSQSLSINCNQETMCIQTSSNVSASSLRFLGVATQRPKLPKHIRQGQYMTIWW